MRKLIKHFIDYGYLLREIGDLVMYSYSGNALLLKFDNEDLGFIANRIRSMRKEIDDLKQQLNNKNGSN